VGNEAHPHRAVWVQIREQSSRNFRHGGTLADSLFVRHRVISYNAKYESLLVNLSRRRKPELQIRFGQ
jgi:hypothetical protein